MKELVEKYEEMLQNIDMNYISSKNAHTTALADKKNLLAEFIKDLKETKC